MLTVAAPVFTAFLCLLLFFAIGPVSDFLAPAVDKPAIVLSSGGQP